MGPTNKGGDMKVRELIEKLREIDQELDVELVVNDEYPTVWELQTINLKWKSFGVVSLESGNCILD